MPTWRAPPDAGFYRLIGYNAHQYISLIGHDDANTSTFPKLQPQAQVVSMLTVMLHYLFHSYRAYLHLLTRDHPISPSHPLT